MRELPYHDREKHAEPPDVLKFSVEGLAMNKAFVRENDSDVRHCPFCGSLGQAVERVTLDAWLQPEFRGQIGDSAMFCSQPQCDVAYFDSFERVVMIDKLTRPAYPKSLEAPICGCFGVLCSEIEADIADGSVVRTRAAVEQAKASETGCSAMSPNGQSCIAEIQRYYFKCKGGGYTPRGHR